METLSVVKFLEKIQSGEYRPINEMAEGGEISMNMPLLIRVLELAKEDVKEDKEIHFIAERLQSIADKGTLTMEDYDYISGLEDNPKIQKMYSDMLERGGGGEVEDLISKGIVELKMFDTKPEHAKEYGLDAKKPLYIETLCVAENERNKGVGEKVLSYIEKYAIENGHDLIFGNITQKAKFTKDKRETFFCDIDMIKNWLHSNGYAINNENNDFHKVIQSNKLEGGGSVLLAPNGKPSNLTPQQWHLVRTPEFKAWFGDWEALENAKIRDRGMDEITLNQLAKNVSKVVDENGEPMVVWHGSKSNEEFNFFKQSSRFEFIYFAKTKEYAWFHFTKDIIDKPFQLRPFFLNIRNLLNAEEYGFEKVDFSELESGFYGIHELSKDIQLNPKRQYRFWEVLRYSNDIYHSLKNEGFYDGISFYENFYDNTTWNDTDDYSLSYVVMNPNQIKLADGKNTTFDGNNPDIRFESGGEIDRSLARKKQEISFDDFHIATFANFKKVRQVDLPKKQPDFVSKSGSRYWYDGDKVYRMSNHWGRIIASCNWLLDGFAVRGLSQGYCKLKDFHREMSYLLNDKNFGKRFLVGKTSFLRSGKGAIDISKNEGVFIKETSDFYVFDTFKVSKMTLAYVKPLQKVDFE